MPWTLWRYIFVEVGRLVVLSTGVLVAVVAFAATVKPLADGKLTAADAVTFMFYAVPPMLAYALPFAGGFGATLAYHRLAQDNEMTACAAGGLGHLRILAPAIGMGLALSIALGGLNDRVIPWFLTRMESMITKDVAQIMIRSLEQGESATFGGVEIHADSVTEVAPEDGSPYTDQFLLTGVTAIEADDTGAVTSEVVASQAWVLMLPASRLPEQDRAQIRTDGTVALLHFRGAFGVGEGASVQGDEFTTPPVALPSAFTDDPKFLNGTQLRELRANPERMNWIDDLRLELARALAAESTIRSLKSRARDVSTVSFDAPNDRTVRVRTSAIESNPDGRGWRLVPAAGAERVEVEVYLPDGSLEQYGARRATLEPRKPRAEDPFAPAVSGSLGFDLRLLEVSVRATSGRSSIATNELPQLAFDRLTTSGDPYDQLRAMSSGELIERARERGESTPKGIANHADRLEREIDKLGREILSKQHERLAMDASCLVMVFTGAVMALRLRHALPLVVYLWSFFPALGTIVLISSGQQTVHRQGLIGVPLLWLGVFALAGFALTMFLKLRRH